MACAKTPCQGEAAVADTTKETQDQVAILRAKLAKLERDARYYPSAAIDARAYSTIQDAVDALPATGGIVDATGLTGTRTISSTVSFGSATRPVTLIMNPRTTYQPSAADVDMFQIGPNGQLVGCRIDTSSVAYTGAAVKFIGAFSNGNKSGMSDCYIKGPASSGTAILLQGTTGNSPVFVRTSNVQIWGFQYGILLDAVDGSHASWVNANVFSDITLASCLYGIKLQGNGDLTGNQFSNINFQMGASVTKAIDLGRGNENQLTNLNVWDVPALSTGLEFGSGSYNNLVIGRVDGNIVDSGNANTFFSLRWEDAVPMRYGMGTGAPAELLHLRLQEKNAGVRIESVTSGDQTVKFMRSGASAETWTIGRDNTDGNWMVDYRGDATGGVGGASTRFLVSAAGQIQAPVTGSSAGLLLGGDAQWYRSAANVLRTPGSMTVDGSATVSGFLTLGPFSTLTISGGVVTATGSYHAIASEGGASTPDQLDTINGGATGSILVLRSASTTADITLADGAGNLALAGNFVLSTTEDRIVLVNHAGTWVEISRSDNS